MNQAEFTFNAPIRKAMPEHPLVVLRALSDGQVESHWPDFDLVARFRDWALALDVVLHPLNEHAQIRIRP